MIYNEYIFEDSKGRKYYKKYKQTFLYKIFVELRRKITDYRNTSYIRRFLMSTPPPRFFRVEIETINKCNMVCSFCPANKNNDIRETKKMENHVFDKILSELAAIGYQGRLALFSNDEPFLDDRIEAFAEQARKALPHAYIYLYTNGTLLTLERFIKIIPHLNMLTINNYNDNLHLNKTTQIIYDYCRDDAILSTKVRINMRKINEVRETRGGESPNKSITKTIPEKCVLPFIQMVIRPDGKISLCCNDVFGKYTLGDVNNQTLCEIWESDNYKKIRKNLIKGRQNIPLCKYCDALDIANYSEMMRKFSTRT